MSKLYVVFSLSEDGETFLCVKSREALTRDLNEDGNNTLCAGNLPLVGEFVNLAEGTVPRGDLIFPLDALVVPEQVTKVTEWRLP